MLKKPTIPTVYESNPTLRLAFLLSFLFFLFAAVAVCAPVAPVSSIQGDLPLAFEPSGPGSWQVHPEGYRAEIRPSGLDLALPSGRTVRLTLDSANANTSAIPSLGQLHFRSVLPGIDAFYYSNRRRLEFDYVLAPGASPTQIRLSVDASDAKLGASGDLTLFDGTSEVKLLRPHAYQEKNGRTVEVPVSYRLQGKTISFDVPKYDSTLPLRIDPVVVVRISPRSSVLEGRSARALTSDSDGNLYVGGLDQAWVAKLDPTGTSEIYRIYIGSTPTDAVNALKIDFNGNLHVAGSRKLNGREKGFVATLDPNGQQTDYSELDEPILALAVDPAGGIYVAGDAFVNSVGGWTLTPPGPVAAMAVDPKGRLYIAGRKPAAMGSGGESEEAYVAILNDKASAWESVLPLSGTGTVNEAQSLAIDTDGSVYVAGITNSVDFPVRNAFQEHLGGAKDAFLVKLLPAGLAVDWATYMGGVGVESNALAAVDPSGNVLVAGTTDSPNFPLADNWNGAEDGFFARFDNTGHLFDSAYIGTSGTDRIAALTLSGNGNAFVAGSTEPGANASLADVLLAKVSAQTTVAQTMIATATRPKSNDVPATNTIIVPASLTVGIGASTSLPVTLSTPVPANVGVLFVQLASDNPAVTVNPVNLIIQAGATVSNVIPTVTGVSFGTANITASASGYTTGSSSVSAADTIAFNPANAIIVGTSNQSLFLIMSASAPAGGVTINLSSSNPSVATVPASVTIPATSNNASVMVTGLKIGTTVIHASSSSFNLADTTATITVNPQLAMVTSSINNSEAGLAFAQTLIALGGRPPYTWSLVGGALPSGLSLNAATGQISGTPSTTITPLPKTFPVTFQVTDSEQSAGIPVGGVNDDSLAAGRADHHDAIPSQRRNHLRVFEGSDGCRRNAALWHVVHYIGSASQRLNVEFIHRNHQRNTHSAGAKSSAHFQGDGFGRACGKCNSQPQPYDCCPGSDHHRSVDRNTPEHRRQYGLRHPAGSACEGCRRLPDR